MASSSSSSPKSSQSLYPEVILSNPEANTFSSSSSSSLYPHVDTDMLENLFPEDHNVLLQQPLDAQEQVIIKVPGAIVHLIEQESSVELACGELSIVSLTQGNNIVAVFARVGDQIQWPLAKDEAAVKLDDSHYFFTLRVPAAADGYDEDSDENGIELNFEVLNYGLTIASKGQTNLLRTFDKVLETYSCFSIKEVKEKPEWMVLNARDVSPSEIEADPEKRDLLAGSSVAYWTALAPNVEDYGNCVARLIAAGSGQLIKGILWCGDVTVDSLKWGDDFLRKNTTTGSSSEINPDTLRKMKMAKTVTKMSEKVAGGILSGVVKVSGFFASSIVNSYPGKRFFSLFPGEIILASLDGFSKVCDALEVAGKNVMSTSAVVTTGLVSHRYGEQAAEVTNEGLGAAGHAIGTAWTVFKIRKALNPKSAIKPTTLAKAAAEARSAKLKAKSNK